MIKTDFKWEINNKEKIIAHGNFTCRFMSFDGKKVVFTNATILTYPVGDEGDPNTVSCKSPKWDLSGGLLREENIRVDVSINGVDYSGDRTILISENLDVYKIVPLCGPNEGSTRVKIIGTGFKQKEEISVKWGVIITRPLDKQALFDFVYNEAEFE